MDEFVSRMATQRHVLEIINSKLVLEEKLFGLSSSAIDRWVKANQIGSTEIVQLIKNISSELFFMATRSQEPVSAEYEVRKTKIIKAVNSLKAAL